METGEPRSGGSSVTPAITASRFYGHDYPWPHGLRRGLYAVAASRLIEALAWNKNDSTVTPVSSRQPRIFNSPELDWPIPSFVVYQSETYRVISAF